MIDHEVERLRRLRGNALQVRALARVLESRLRVEDDAALAAGQLAAWRVARTVSGHLRAHPYVRFQKDVSVPTLIVNALASRVAAWGAATPAQATGVLAACLKRLLRELDDARSLTRDAQLSEAFGRSQHEIRSLVHALSAGQRLHAGANLGTRGTEAVRDWPYLAI